MVKILLSGCCGKMGTVISNLANEFPNLEIIGGIDKFPQELSYPIFKTPEEVNIEYDVLLDFSNVSTLHGLLKLTEEQFNQVDHNYFIKTRKENYGYTALTNQKQFYQENYPEIIIEKNNFDTLFSMMLRGE